MQEPSPVDLSQPEPPPSPSSANPSLAAATTRRADAVALVALARLERDHVALLAALCDLETRAATSTRRAGAGASGLSAPMRQALAGLLRADLRQTQRALALAAEGRYGVCLDCQVPLSSVALLMTPATTRCPSCLRSADRTRQVH